jgi:hypothetical protein
MWHVWQSGFDPDGLVDDQVIVVGGGITAAQVACQLATRTSVTLVSRHPLRESLIEASPRWIGWGHIGTHLHTLPAGSKKRHERVCEARNDGTVPSYVMKRLVELRDHGDLVVEQGEITDGVRDERGQTIRFRDGSTRSGYRWSSLQGSSRHIPTRSSNGLESNWSWKPATAGCRFSTTTRSSGIERGRDDPEFSLRVCWRRGLSAPSPGTSSERGERLSESLRPGYPLIVREPRPL